jgi:hypothetical protein
MLFCFVLYSVFLISDFIEDKMHLNNKNKKYVILFCIVFGFHYLCKVINQRLFNLIPLMK